MPYRRIEYSGAIYHVTQRGNNREAVLSLDEDKTNLLDLLGRYKNRLDFNIFGYVLMDNHYHLLIKVGNTPLNKIMHRINHQYSMNYNRKSNRTGHVFGGRYKAGLIQDEKYLFAVLRYVHWNPLRAGICSQVYDYRWSSDRAYRNNEDGLTDIGFILDTFSSERLKAVETYKRLMQTEEDTDYEKLGLIGDDDFKEAQLTEQDENKATVGTQRQSLEEIIAETGANDDDLDLIKSGSRKRHLRKYKVDYVIKAVSAGYTYKEIGNYINVSGAAIFRLIN